MQRSLLIAFLCLSPAGVAQNAPAHFSRPAARPQAGTTAMLPVTTTSAQARALYQQAMTDSMNFHLDRALGQWRAAVKLDPNFALAHLMIAFRSQHPKEARAALQRANTAVRRGSYGERLFVRWITGIREGNFLSGIAAMNDLIARYPFDKQLLSLAGNWLMGRYSYDRAAELLNRALAVDPDYPPALNSAAYAYAGMGDFAKAIQTMEHYAEVLPNEPNAQDSYAEILRQAGQFDAAVGHYQAALKIAPGFSIMGLADTYALKGDEERARAEYRRCNQHAEMSEDRILCRLQYPITYVWEKDYRAADQAFESAAQWAHVHDLGFAEAQAYRMMAMYQEDDSVALKHLERAAAALNEHASVSRSDHQDETARILRWRVTRALHAGDKNTAEHAMQQLRTIADHGPSEIVQRALNAALGAQLMAESKPLQAIPYLREDFKDACSLALLVKAYELTADKQMAAAQRAALAHFNLPTVETAMVVPAFRSAEAAH
ncbi:MAG: tetratricopeptide repeat protein [Acidobacteriia bacterium]|nr:tetratricopeptide repeat protein [Terriglobia bacterium]